MDRLKDKVAIVFGAGPNIGGTIAHFLAREGARVCVTDVSEDAANETVAFLKDKGLEAFGIVANARDNDQVREAVAATVEKYGRLDIAVNMAGRVHWSHVLDMDLDDWNDAVASFPTAGLITTQHCARATSLADEHTCGNVLAAYQCLLPGETARPHRHNMNALRFMLEGSGAITLIDGKECPMEYGDLVLTPGMAWHEHRHDGDEPVLWLDVLDVPLHMYLGSVVFQPGPIDPKPDTIPDAAFAVPNIAPCVTYDYMERSPVFRYPYDDAVRALQHAPVSKASGALCESAHWTGRHAAVGYVRAKAEQLLLHATTFPVTEVRFLSPVAEPGKIIGVPVNYQKHVEEAAADVATFTNRETGSVLEQGFFLKANSSLIGCGQAVRVHFPERLTHHEIELGAIIGKTAKNVSEQDALSYIAGYSIALDMTVRGAEDRSLRKSVDTYSVLGPWMVTADEVADAQNLNLHLKVNGQDRQVANTSEMIVYLAEQIAWVSRFYTLQPGSVIMTGTCEGVGPVVPGDEIWASIESIGEMSVKVTAADS